MTETYLFRFFLDDSELQQEGYVTGEDFEDALKNTGWETTELITLIKIAPLNTVQALTDTSKVITGEVDWDDEGHIEPLIEKVVFKNGKAVEETKFRYDTKGL